jgi:vacuolar-type H+-ATPase subunit I/STV1
VDIPRQTAAESHLIEKLDTWRKQVGAFDDESPEYVLSWDLMLAIEDEAKGIQHEQDLLNTCFQANGYVPFFVKIYQKQLLEIIKSAN